MAKLACLLLLAFLVISLVATSADYGHGHGQGHGHGHGHGHAHGPGSLTIDQCPSECDRRCGNTQYKNACLEFCNKCCIKCLCVPPGFYGNKAVCGACYNNWKTKEGGPKCP